MRVGPILRRICLPKRDRPDPIERQSADEGQRSIRDVEVLAKRSRYSTDLLHSSDIGRKRIKVPKPITMEEWMATYTSSEELGAAAWSDQEIGSAAGGS